MTPDQLLDRILDEARKQSITPQRLADESDLAYSAAHKLLNGEARRPTLASVMALAAVVGWEVRVGPA
jgi:hypothetical protein